jgi:hypothetical protein
VQCRENEVGVGADGGGVWAASAVASGTRPPKRRIGRPLKNIRYLGPVVGERSRALSETGCGW